MNARELQEHPPHLIGILTAERQEKVRQALERAGIPSMNDTQRATLGERALPLLSKYANPERGRRLGERLAEQHRRTNAFIQGSTR